MSKAATQKCLEKAQTFCDFFAGFLAEFGEVFVHANGPTRHPDTNEHNWRRAVLALVEPYRGIDASWTDNDARRLSFLQVLSDPAPDFESLVDIGSGEEFYVAVFEDYLRGVWRFIFRTGGDDAWSWKFERGRYGKNELLAGLDCLGVVPPNARYWQNEQLARRIYEKLWHRYHHTELLDRVREVVAEAARADERVQTAPES